MFSNIVLPDDNYDLVVENTKIVEVENKYGRRSLGISAKLLIDSGPFKYVPIVLWMNRDFGDHYRLQLNMIFNGLVYQCGLLDAEVSTIAILMFDRRFTGFIESYGRKRTYRRLKIGN